MKSRILLVKRMTEHEDFAYLKRTHSRIAKLAEEAESHHFKRKHDQSLIVNVWDWLSCHDVDHISKLEPGFTCNCMECYLDDGNFKLWEEGTPCDPLYRDKQNWFEPQPSRKSSSCDCDDGLHFAPCFGFAGWKPSQ